MKFPIEFIFSRELSLVHGYLFGMLTKPFEGFSVICYLHLSFERYDEPLDKIHKLFEFCGTEVAMYFVVAPHVVLFQHFDFVLADRQPKKF